MRSWAANQVVILLVAENGLVHCGKLALAVYSLLP